ncbi:MAG: class I SAM-dependent methyltransferase [Terriglobia bacterium]
MATTPQAQPPSPAILFDTLNAYQRTASLKAAIELDVFTAIGEGNATLAALAPRCAASEKGMRVLCDYLTVAGLLTKDGNAYALTPESAAFLDRRLPTYMGTIARFINSPELMDSFKDVAAVVRKGGTIASEEGTVEPENPLWVEFARSMAPMMTLPAEMIAKITGAQSGEPWKVLDIAAGHGLFGITIAKHNPQAAIVAVDWAGVLEVAKENARVAGVAARYSTLPGSAFEADFGGGYDLALITNFLHHFDPPTCEALLRRVHAALKPGGRAATLEFVPNDDRVSPPVAAQFSLMMLGTTRAGDAYTFREFEDMFRNAGFSRSEIHPLSPTPQQLIISYG